jgi:putative transposase
VTDLMPEPVVDLDVVSGAEAVPAAAAGADVLDAIDEQLIARLAGRARDGGLQLTGEGGLLAQLTKRLVESALQGEITDHLGYDRHEVAGRDGGNSRNGHRAKTVLTEVGPVEIDVPRDRDGSFEPKIVAKRKRRLSGVDELVISLSAKGLTTGDVQAHLAEIYGADVSRQTISTITDKVIEGMAEWRNRPLDPVYPVVFIDAINVKIRDGKVANRPIYVALAVTCEGRRDILGLWAGEAPSVTGAPGGEGAKYWLHVLTEIKNRGVGDVLMVVCDGLTGLPDAISTVWPNDHPDLRGPSPAQQLPLRRAPALRRHRQSAASGLHRAHGGGGDGAVPGVLRDLGHPLPGDRAVVGERLGRVRAVPEIRSMLQNRRAARVDLR